MTPEREAYLAKCSDKEKSIRMILKTQQRALKQYKEILTYGYTDAEEHCYFKIALYQISIQALRHELARLKGMDRVAVPRNYRECNVSITGHFATCKCGRDVSWERSCPNCGRNILWGKVK